MASIDYKEAVSFRKKEYNLNGWNRLVIKASDLIGLTDKADVRAVCDGMLKNMLEGDSFAKDFPDPYTPDLEIIYYCDNLSESRRRLY